jgi:tripartite-type tricarboxylate transporter receptor subunit TctC
MPLTVHRLCVNVAAVAAFALAAPLAAQTFPSRPVRIIVPFPAGGPSDLLTRMMAPKLTEIWGQQITVDNRPGAGTIIGTELGAKAAPDGYTVALVSTGHATNPGLHSKLPYDTLADFAPVTLGTTLPMIIVAHPSFAAHSFKAFIALAKTRPGEIGFATSGNGTTGHLGGELLKSVAHINLVHIPYKGSAPAIADVLGGQVATTFDGLPAALPHVQAGKLNAFAVMSTERSPLLPNVVTVAESGFPGYSADSWFGFVVPAKTPPAVVRQLNADMVKVVKLPEIRDRLSAMGYRPIANTPEEFNAFIRAEMTKWAKVIKDSGARLD